MRVATHVIVIAVVMMAPMLAAFMLPPHVVDIVRAPVVASAVKAPAVFASKAAAAAAAPAVLMMGSADAGEDSDDLARQAGAAAVAADVEEQSRDAKKSDSARVRDAKGKALLVTLQEKPLGIVLANNPSGRGVFVADILSYGQK